jgi:excisionase family DNA binding protein
MTDLEKSIGDMVRRIVREELASVVAKPPTEYLSTSEAAELARVAPGTIRRWIREERLDRHKAGREVRVKRDQLEQLLRSDRRPANDLTPEELALRDFG